MTAHRSDGEYLVRRHNHDATIVIRFAIILCLCGLLATNAFSQSNAGIGTTTPHASALLEISGFTQGLLMPRVTNAQRNAIATPKTGLIIYQTDATATEASTFYYWNGWKWVPWGGTADLWLITGNAGTIAGTNFLGTKDSVTLVNKTNSTTRWRFFAGGDIELSSTTTAQGLRFLEPSGSGVDYTDIRARAQAYDIPWVLPDSQGLARQVLMNDGSGNLFWGNQGATVTLSTVSLSTFSGNINDMSIPDGKSYIRICGTANYDLTGIQGGVDGRFIIVCNVCPNTFRVVQESTASSASNRLLTGGGGTFSLALDESALWVYDGISQRWRLTAKTP